MTRGSERRLRYGFFIAKLSILFELFEQIKHFVRVHAMEACRRSRRIAPLILNLGVWWRWCGQHNDLAAFFPAKNRRLNGPRSRSGRIG